MCIRDRLRPGVAILSRYGFAEPPEIIQELETPVEIPFQGLDGDDSGAFVLRRTSRPILKARIPVGDQVITVFNCHLKSKLGEFTRDENGNATEAALTNYDPLARAMGAMRAALPRMAECGGSHAQRDLFEQIHLDALVRDGRASAAQQVLEMRRTYDPEGVPLNLMLGEVYEKTGLPDLAAQARARAEKTLTGA